MILRPDATLKRSFAISGLQARPASSGAGRLHGTCIRILSLDSHPLFRAGIARIIREEPDMTLVSQASTVQEAIAQYREHLPDVMLMETWLPDLSGMEALIA